jgi:hypothetical protein
MPKATDALLKDHKMISKALSEFTLDNPRYPQLLKTVQRIVVAHAWFEDAIFLPAFEAEPLLERRFTAELYQEHKDIDHLLKALRKAVLSRPTPSDKPGPRLAPTANRDGALAAPREPAAEALFLQFRTVLDTHFKKEEYALFPLAERILDDAGLNALGAEMERRKTEVRGLTEP